jgi:hypothetical protein
MAAENLEAEVKSFIDSYSALFSSPGTSSTAHVAQVAEDVSKHYRAGVTFFTNGQISRFEVRRSLDTHSSRSTDIHRRPKQRLRI